MIRWTNGSCSNDNLSWTWLSKSNARTRRCRNTSWLARSTIPFFSLEYAVAKNCIWVQVQWPIHCGRLVLDPNWQTLLSIMEAISAAVVDLAGKTSTHLENASIITRIYSLPCASLGSGPIWSRWRTSNGLCEAHVNRWALTCWVLSNELWHHAISDISLWCTSRSRRLQMSNLQWPTLELWTVDNRAWMWGGNTMTGRRVTMRRSAKVGGRGTWFVHSLDNASGTNWCSSLPGTWNKPKSLSCK